jgi:REP element-mobilizing transposase RayT
MPRRPRVFVSGAVYHVYCRVARGEPVFSDAREAAALVGVIREVTREHGLSVLAWCVMATHYHLAVRVGRVPLWRSMRLIQGRFARSHNRRHRLLGPFWQGRYKAIVVPDQRYLQQLIAYIHLNLVTAKVVSDPARHRWSGHRELLGKVAEPLVDVNEALVLFGRRRSAARRAYVRMLRGERRAEWIGERPDRLPWWRGSQEPDEPITLVKGRPRIDALGASTLPQRAHWGVEEYLTRACKVHGLELSELSGRRKDETTARLRELLTLMGVEVYGLRVKDLAEGMGMNPGSASRVLARATEREREDRTFHEQRLRLEERLAKLDAGGPRSRR